MQPKNTPFYFLALAIFLLLKVGYKFTDNDDLLFLLYPTDWLVGLLTGSASVYTPENGFFHGRLNMVVDKSCAGFNYWVLSFLLFTYLAVNHLKNNKEKASALFFALLGAYFFTIFVNASRIFVTIIVQPKTQHLLPNHQHLVHEAIGVVTNLTFLVLAYMLLEKILKRKQTHEKLT